MHEPLSVRLLPGFESKVFRFFSFLTFIGLAISPADTKHMSAQKTELSTEHSTQNKFVIVSCLYLEESQNAFFSKAKQKERCEKQHGAHHEGLIPAGIGEGTGLWFTCLLHVPDADDVWPVLQCFSKEWVRHSQDDGGPE